ncbi:oxygenase MpaB family protein [Nocardia ninae]|uniref:ER-bound oxygenase mpaB/mpaB'/Rubber oxygenase catalytic domain-containing protein n=1 Tax=Nocardia ninae NBRC 108245 TaxID=1210091 RepID=A0A511MCT9_9NOCA|nr:oxygenase MpaB family protein [Nocardia ninae]GEM38472.1 hypothetical protein NN4_29910 [Nocardia ninae NBRC 108245]
MTQIHPDHSSSSPVEQPAHRFDYYYREGMDLRPAPRGYAASELWQPLRRFLLTPWRPVEDGPSQTPLARLHADHRWQSDELMDDVVAMFHREGPARGRQLFDTALEDGIATLDDPPRELVRLFDKLDNPPARFAPERIEAGRRVWLSRSPLGRATELTVNLINTIMAPDVSAAVGATGRFARDGMRRNLETFAFFETVTRADALTRHGDGFKDVVRIGLMHAQVSRALRKTWGPDAYDQYGAPISASGLAAGYLAFGLVPLFYDHALGHTCTPADMEAVTDYWGYIAYLLGAPAYLIPDTATDIIDYGDYIVTHIGEPSAWTPEVARVLVDTTTDIPLSLAPDTAWARQILSPVSRHLFTPLLLGHLTHLFGPTVVSTAIAHTRYRTLNLNSWAILGGALSMTLVRGSSIGHQLRTLGGRRTLPTPPVDPLIKALHTRYHAYTQRHTNLTTVYNSHDHTTTSDLAPLDPNPAQATSPRPTGPEQP